MPATDLDQVVNLCKRRGFVFPSAEIYGGFRSTYDYGPLGALMLRNVKDAWVRAMVQQRDDIVLIDAAILSPPAIWEASGHLQNFTDPLVDCTVCNRRFREDQLDQRDCPRDFKVCEFTSARAFNLMFKTHAGPVEDEGAVAYLRPETAQGMFTNFANVLQATRKKPPFGIAQVGKSFRNEITPGNFVFRTREFEQMETRVLRTSRRGCEVVRVLVRRADAVVHRARHPRPICSASAPTTPTSCPTTRRAPPTWSFSIHGVGASSRASPTARTSI